jgi:hypothetical protein
MSGDTIVYHDPDRGTSRKMLGLLREARFATQGR